MNELGTLVEGKSILVCAGSGGVGKTTTAAALGVAAAALGRRACVVTIDPARRLANAIGTERVANAPTRIEGAWPGTLDAVMLDAAGTLDELVRRYSSGVEQAERIMRNGIYSNLATALSGTQEYMATEKLYELHESGDYDLVVVDTPPTRHALDFLDAPGRLTRFLDNRVFRLLVMPGRAYLRAVSVATQMLLRTIARVAGSEIVDDTIAFFQAFDGLELGFRERAGRVGELLASDRTAFALVVAPRRDSIEEAHFFAGKLRDTGHAVDVLVVNRVHPRYPHARSLLAGRNGSSPAQAGGATGATGATGTAATAGAAGSDGSDGGHAADGSAPLAGAWEQLLANLRQLDTVSEREQGYLRALVAEVEPSPVVQVPFLDDDVHDLGGLAVVARHLVGDPLPLLRGEPAARQ